MNGRGAGGGGGGGGGGGCSKRGPQAGDGLVTMVQEVVVKRRGCKHKIFPYNGKW